jgi:uncharacterized membrane protein HdeD (DUF308 family)
MPAMSATAPLDAAAPLGARWGWLLALGILEIIAGGVAIAIPLLASLAAVVVFGAALIVAAVSQLVHAFQLRGRRRSALYVLSGVLYAVAGVLVIAYPVGGALTLAIWIAVLLIVSGGLRAIFAMAVRPVPGWGWLLAGGIAGIVVGVMLLVGWPATALWGIGVLLGINLIFTGAMNCSLALSSRARTAHAV